jgi:indoleamine 2,3-dioxygenase
MNTASLGPAEFGVSPKTGYLPETDPLDRLPSDFDAWEAFAHDLPKLLMTDLLRDLVENLLEFPVAAIANHRQWERAMVLLSYIGHAYVWCGPKAADRLPAVLAKPWHAVAVHLGRPPVLSYASYALHNWRRIKPDGPIAVGNIALLQNFLAGEDEEWFILIHVDIEFRAAAALGQLISLQSSVTNGDSEGVESALKAILPALEGMNATMNRMPERCDPYIYYNRVRPYIHGWRNHPDLPNGIVYEGVAEFNDMPQTFRGETGAQSGIVPALDAVLGVSHAPDELRTYLMEMRQYMPPDHRAFVENLEAGPSLRTFAHDGGGNVKELYNACVAQVEQFRSKHLEYAAKYIFHQAQKDSKNPHDVGTGGTPFMPYLKKHRDETRDSALS